MRIAIAALFLLTAATSAASVETISGRASVIDADTLQINGERIRILDIDAPEKEQFCQQAVGDVTWECGMEATFALIDWIGESDVVARAIAAHPRAGGIGGKVVLDWERPPPAYLGEFGFCFAAQDHGNADCLVDSLAGAGMVLRRSALAESGWMERPLVADRIGTNLTSGGDVEIAQRVRAAGYELWFAPAAVLRHRIPSGRMGRGYLFRINRELGASSAVIGLLTCSEDWGAWQRDAHARRRRWRATALQGLRYALRRRRGLTSAIAWACFAAGFSQGLRRCEALDDARKAELLGAAAAR